MLPVLPASLGLSLLELGALGFKLQTWFVCTKCSQWQSHDCSVSFCCFWDKVSLSSLGLPGTLFSSCSTFLVLRFLMCAIGLPATTVFKDWKAALIKTQHLINFLFLSLDWNTVFKIIIQLSCDTYLIHISKGCLFLLQRYSLSHIQCCSIQSKKKLNKNYMYTNWRMDKENKVYLHNKILLKYLNKWNHEMRR